MPTMEHYHAVHVVIKRYIDKIGLLSHDLRNHTSSTMHVLRCYFASGRLSGQLYYVFIDIGKS